MHYGLEVSTRGCNLMVPTWRLQLGGSNSKGSFSIAQTLLPIQKLRKSPKIAATTKTAATTGNCRTPMAALFQTLLHALQTIISRYSTQARCFGELRACVDRLQSTMLCRHSKEAAPETPKKQHDAFKTLHTSSTTLWRHSTQALDPTLPFYKTTPKVPLYKTTPNKRLMLNLMLTHDANISCKHMMQTSDANISRKHPILQDHCKQAIIQNH